MMMMMIMMMMMLTWQMFFSRLGSLSALFDVWIAPGRCRRSFESFQTGAAERQLAVLGGQQSVEVGVSTQPSFEQLDAPMKRRAFVRQRRAAAATAADVGTFATSLITSTAHLRRLCHQWTTELELILELADHGSTISVGPGQSFMEVIAANSI